VEEDLGVATVEVTAGVETAEEEDSEVVKDSVVVDWGAVMAAEDSEAVVVMVVDSEVVDSVAVEDLVVVSEAVDSVAAVDSEAVDSVAAVGSAVEDSGVDSAEAEMGAVEDSGVEEVVDSGAEAAGVDSEVAEVTEVATWEVAAELRASSHLTYLSLEHLFRTSSCTRRSWHNLSKRTRTPVSSRLVSLGNLSQTYDLHRLTSSKFRSPGQHLSRRR
jgi:hypothetical protein